MAGTHWGELTGRMGSNACALSQPSQLPCLAASALPWAAGPTCGGDGEGPGLAQCERQVAQHGGQRVLLLVPRITEGGRWGGGWGWVGVQRAAGEACSAPGWPASTLQALAKPFCRRSNLAGPAASGACPPVPGRACSLPVVGALKRVGGSVGTAAEQSWQILLLGGAPHGRAIVV